MSRYEMSRWFSRYGDRVFDFIGFVDAATEQIAYFIQQTLMLVFCVTILLLFLLPVGIADYTRSKITSWLHG